MYPLLFDLVLRRLDSERAHHLGAAVIRTFGTAVPGAVARAATQPHPSLAVEALGLRFPSPFGVAAGFDKQGSMILGLGNLGFGHIEVGTVTAIPQPGNDRPRLFRLIPDRALINRMGFNNDGAQAVAERLRRVRARRRRPIIGVNIGKSRVVAVEDAAEDYRTSTRILAPLADYLVVNVSSPNTPGLRGLQDREQLEPLLRAVLSEAGEVPVLVKIAPDLDDQAIEDIASLATELGLAGVIATNTTVGREGLRTPRSAVARAGAGGLSGAPLAERSLEVLGLLARVADPSLVLIAVGGVETAADVRARLDAGAHLVQGYTAFLYRGPLWARQINRGLRAH